MCICCVADKVLKDTLDKVLLSGYFDRVRTHQNGAACEEVEEAEEPSQTVEEEQQPKAEEQPSEPGNHRSTTKHVVSVSGKRAGSRPFEWTHD